MKSAEEFWSKLRKLDNGCWEKPSRNNCKTYYTVKWFDTVIAAHRLAAFLSGKLPTLNAPRSSKANDHVLHTCDNKRCCNPAHLQVGSYSRNLIDAYRRNVRQSKLSMKTANDIRKFHTSGLSQVELGKTYGVSQAAISKIVRNEHYKCELGAA